MIPSLGGIGLFRGKLVNLCGKVAQIPVTVNGTLTEEYFEIIKFIGDKAPFTMLLGKPWNERDQARKKEEEKVLEQQRQELKDFMTRRIAQLIKEKEDKSNLLSARSSDIKVIKELEDPQKTGVSVSDINEVVTLSHGREPQQREVTMPKENRNQNGKRQTKLKITGKKARRLSKKREKIEKLQEIPDGTLQKENLQNRSFTEILEQRPMALHHGEVI
jgi:hypothetical protein